MPVLVPGDVWLFSHDVNPVRANMLLSWHWSDIVAEIVANASRPVTDYDKGNPGGEFEGCWRPIVTVHLQSETVDRFHNGAGGIRAQHYESAASGMDASREICGAMVDTLVRFWAAEEGREWINDVEVSFRSPYAKAWIHQGPWLRTAPIALRNLLVARWVVANEQGAPANKPNRFGYWPSLMPELETRLDFKGAWVKDGVIFDLGDVFIRQAKENHDYGYS